MKSIKAHEIYHCTFCRSLKLKTRSVVRSTGCTLNKSACVQHKPELELYERQQKAPKRDDHMSEADEQTWGRL